MKKYKIFLILLLTLTVNQQLLARCNKSLRADYVIVGAGTAGAVVARKLSDDKKTSVIALHNGPNVSNDPEIKFSENTLFTVLSGLFGPPLFETGDTLPQPNADNRELTWTIALPFGGASSINASAFCRGTNQVFSQWESIAGPDWSVSRILEIYKDLETYDGDTTNPGARGFNGPIHVLQDPSPSGTSQKFTQAFTDATGFPFVLDYNDPNTPIGPSSQLQYTHKGPDGAIRVSSATAFLNHNVMTPDGYGRHGRKLRVLFDSPALRTLWKGNKAIGVEYLDGDKVRRVYARKGVIVCAGLKSSFFLLHSGVGPRALLESYNIPVVYDNPNVGQNLADQPSVRMVFVTNPEDADLNFNNLFTQIAWLPSPSGDPTIRELRFASANPIPGINVGFLDLCQPRSRGFVSINSSDPLDPPVVSMGSLTEAEDLDILKQGMQVYIKNLNLALQAIDSQYQLVYPDPAILTNDSLVIDFIKEGISCQEHFQSHCRMAPLNQGGVVDSKGKVYGVSNLFVADNSIVPQCMDGSPMATGFLIGANIADLINQQ